MEVLIKKRRTQRQGLAFDLDYRWDWKRHRPLLGYDLTPAQAQQRAIDMIKKIQANPLPELLREQRLPTVRDLLPLFWETFQIKKRLDRTRPAGIFENHILSCHRCAKLGVSCEHRFGHRPLASLTPEDGLRYVKARMEEKGHCRDDSPGMAGVDANPQCGGSL